MPLPREPGDDSDEEVESRPVAALGPALPVSPVSPAPSPAPRPTPLWVARLAKDSHGSLLPEIGNATLLLVHHDDFAGALRFNAFAHQVLVGKLPPMHGLTAPAPGPLSDLHESYLRCALRDRTRTSFAAAVVHDALQLAAAERTVHPLQDYLSGLVWDGQPRIDSWLETYLGAEPSPAASIAGRKFLLQCVARAMQPGCQADYTLLLIGAVRIGKSTAARILGGPWTLEKLPRIREYERAAHALQGFWIVEIGELDAFRGAADSQLKEFLTLRRDTFRAAYAHHPVTRLRTVSCIATTNSDAPIHDLTSGSRFWPVRVARLDREGLERDRDQLWAEALRVYHAGLAGDPAGQWWPDPADATLLADAQDEHYDADDWQRRIADWLDSEQAQDLLARSELTTGAALSALGVETARQDRSAQTRAGDALQELGYTRTRRRLPGRGRTYVYLKSASQPVPSSLEPAPGRTDCPDSQEEPCPHLSIPHFDENGDNSW